MDLDSSNVDETADYALRLSRFESNLITVMFGFSRWVETCMNAVDSKGVNALDIFVLDAINSKSEGLKTADIGPIVNVEDSYLVSYSLQKLIQLKFLKFEKMGRERIFRLTSEGHLACKSFEKIRDQFLVREVISNPQEFSKLSTLSDTLVGLVEIYKNAEREALLEAAGKPKSPPARTKR